jgi:hypothetical protein
MSADTVAAVEDVQARSRSHHDCLDHLCELLCSDEPDFVGIHDALNELSSARGELAQSVAWLRTLARADGKREAGVGEELQRFGWQLTPPGVALLTAMDKFRAGWSHEEETLPALLVRAMDYMEVSRSFGVVLASATEALA